MSADVRTKRVYELPSSAPATALSSRPTRTSSPSSAPARAGRVTIVYDARDGQHNNAVVVAERLRDG